MDDFDDFVSRPNEHHHTQDPFADVAQTHATATAGAHTGLAPRQNHSLIDADDDDTPNFYSIGGDEDDDDPVLITPHSGAPIAGRPPSPGVASIATYDTSRLGAPRTDVFGTSDPALMGSMESGLALASAGAMPAGYSNGGGAATNPFGDADSLSGNFKSIEADDEDGLGGRPGPHGQWVYDDYEQPPLAVGGRAPWSQKKRKSVKPSSRLPGDSRFEGFKRTIRNAWPSRSSKVQVGERTVYINKMDANELERFCDNSVSTSKYNIVTFLPKFLAEQFSKYANLFFLFTAAIQQIPNVSPTNRWTTIVPLGIVLLASAFKETQEDLKRHQSDAELNARLTQVLNPSTGAFEQRRWRNVRVGDIVRVENDDFFPADLVLLSSSEPEGLCYTETSNLDGETNLKIKQASPDTSRLTSASSVVALSGVLKSEQPNNSLYTFDATLHIQLSSTPGFSGVPEKKIPLDPSQLLLRGAQLRNTNWVYGLVVFTGHETKLMRNATAAPIKRTAVEREVNVQIIFLFIILLALSIATSIGAVIRNSVYANEMWYLLLSSDSQSKARIFIEDILTSIILYNNLIPISLIVTMEVVKFQQALLINSDLDMYYAPTDTPALCRTSSLVEELGQIEFIFSDKTGTLTRNEMEFKQCSIGGVAYAETIDDGKFGDSEFGPDGTEGGLHRTFAEMDALLEGTIPDDGTAAVVDEFLVLLAVCHTVIPERKDEKIVFQASSPDEAALVAGAQELGYQFTVRKPRSVFVDIRGMEKEYEILNVCEFNSTRKRMSTIVRCPDGKIKLYTKGADTVIFERLSENQPYAEQTLVHLEDYATDGLRTLCIAMREISEQEYRQWAAIYDKAAATIQGRAEALDKAAEIIEKDLFLLGATAIEDKLQEGVPDTIHTLQQAGIKIWVLTGDRQETAINIGLSCRLISESMNLVIVNEETAHETKDFISRRLLAIKNQRNSGELEELALVIDGKSLSFALEKDLSRTFLELALMCKAVVCCRVSPLQKALVVKLVKKNLKAILLAIGDGANDVSMIQAAHVGVGISGVEGLQAARSADVAISQFRYLRKLLLVHGAWSYQRLSKLILYSFYKNITLYMTQFWYSFQNGFSGQISYESWTFSFYNVLFTVLPPLVVGVFDQFVSARMLDRYPQLYTLGQRNHFFNKRSFWAWCLNAFYHSLILYIFPTVTFWGSLMLPGGHNTYSWIWGTTMYFCVLTTVLGKAALISDLWTKYTFAAIPGSWLFTLGFLTLYALISPRLGFSTEYDGIVPRLWGFATFWFAMFLAPVVCLIRDFAWKYYQRTYSPKTYHIVQEVQKYNLQDYRPRMEQFQSAIRKVRAVQRMRRTRGFAFSQNETTGEQAKLIRQYDTDLRKPKGI